MSATIYYLSDYARRRRRTQHPPVVVDDHRQQAGVVFGLLLFAVIFIIIGVVLVDGIASVGRTHSDCLQSGRRACGLFHSARAGDGGPSGVSTPDVAKMNHIVVYQTHLRTA